MGSICGRQTSDQVVSHVEESIIVSHIEEYIIIMVMKGFVNYAPTIVEHLL